MAISGNLLNAQDEDFESAGVGNWVVGANCTLSNSTVQAHTGTHSLLVTSSAAGVTYPDSSNTSITTCVPGETVRVSVWFFAPTITAFVTATAINFFSAGRVYVSTLNNAAIAAAASWQNQTADFVVPATCVTMELVPSWPAVAAGELVYFDTMSITRPQLPPRHPTTLQAVRRASNW